MASDLPSASRRFLESIDFDAEVKMFPGGTKTAEDAATAIGCHVSAIVKSLVFTVDDEPVVALVPGDLRLDTAKLASAAGGTRAARADLDVVRDASGYAAGGTPPFGHATDLRVFADPALKRNDPVWAAAGTPTTVFPISIADLDRLATPTWVDLT
ncbi:MAG TPA: YbaK/EbsC family protein [Acidimicrobiia bacterium]|nr:YbaK/EbsC family protein [Acidimicrobiia bacterium]